VELILDIARHLGVPVVAEGVETERQVQLLKSAGCDLIQGYYFSKPVPPEEFEKLIIREKQIARENEA
jgi:EAL domain-containing protein (putative c-di-GMP-specific phosphodiesterase class I)